MPQRVLRDIGIIAELHLLEDAATVGANGLDTQVEFLADLGQCLPRSDFPHDLELALGEDVVGWQIFSAQLAGDTMGDAGA